MMAPEIDTPLPIADLVVPEHAPEATISERYAAWIEANAWVLNVIERLADDYRRRGARRVGMKHLAEIVRYEYGKATTGDEFRLNNNYTALLTRSLIDRRPDLAPLFETRERRAA